jgi:tetratricopeptide (TPR) repeat protein
MELRFKLLCQLHFSYFKCGDYQKSANICREVLLNSPTDNYALHGLIMNLYMLGKKEEAFNVLRTNYHSFCNADELINDFRNVIASDNNDDDFKLLEQIISEHAPVSV